MVLKGGKYEPRVRKRRALAREPEPDQDDPNAIIGADGKKVTGKKAKRLAKYLDLKLKKDENKALKDRLATNVVDTSLFVSSKNLGQTKMTKRQKLQHALEEERRGVAGDEARQLLMEEHGNAKRKRGGAITREVKSDGKTSKASEDEKADEQKKATQTEVEPENMVVEDESSSEVEGAIKHLAALPKLAAPIVPTFGGGLKRPLGVDNDGRPVLQKRQRRGGVTSKFSIQQWRPQHAAPVEDEDSWSGFSDVNSDGGSSGSDGSSEDEPGDGDASSGTNESPDPEDDGEDESSDEDTVADDQEDDTSNIGAMKEAKKQRSSAFKDWANQKRNEALGFVPTTNSAILEIPQTENFEPRPAEEDPLPLELQTTKNDDRKAFIITVNRKPEIQAARLKLPVVSEEQRIMEAIHNNDTVVICGTTGSGKTTQVPQFLYEAGYGTPGSPTPGMIGITQPRRVATVSMSKRVADELGDKGTSVAYQIRFEGNVSDDTGIKFMTDGLLLREMSQDPFLRKYSAIVLDEAHERSLNTDILLGLLSELVRYRGKLKHGLPPLKLIIMSATLRVSDLTQNPRLFKMPPPVLQVEGKQFPVSMHFSGVTKHSYVEEAFNKIKKGHKKLPPGGMLVFLTGQNEIYHLQKLMKQEFGGSAATHKPSAAPISGAEIGLEAEDIDFGAQDNSFDPKANMVDDYEDEDSEEEKEFDIEEEEGQESGPGPLKMHVLPLYSMLPVKDQVKVFQPPPPNSRLVIIATNIAETSLTIPGIRYVFDCGRAKERTLHKETGVQSFDVGWISKASAAQRAGRAGRTGPGHCYRLYSSAVYERDFPEFAEPEILRTPIEGVVLELKTRGRSKVDRFPFPTSPNLSAISKAEALLSYLLALDGNGKTTSIGDTMSIFPLAPRIARILIAGHREGCLPYIIAIVAGLSASGEIFIPENRIIPPQGPAANHTAEGDDDSQAVIRTNKNMLDDRKRDQLRRAYGRTFSKFTTLGQTDLMMLMHAVMEFSHDPTPQWCREHFLYHKTLVEVRQLRQQLTALLARNVPELRGLKWQDKINPPDERQRGFILQMSASGFVDQVAIRADLHPTPPDVRKAARAIDVAYVPLQPIHTPGTLVETDEEKCIYIHPTSPLSRMSATECPEYIIYRQLQRAGSQSSSSSSSSSSSGRTAKTRMLPLTSIDARLLAGLARDTPLLHWGKPVKEVSSDGSVREAYFAPEMKIPGTPGQGWPLPPRKIRQRKVAGRGWVVITLEEERKMAACAAK
ncbi:DEAH box polypeptide 37 [Zalerion maritima]|uniref:RNA helicase n=1 Tax=Zalerion maritima TaxID=339359 RepID=A0AAD5WY43_9PEZI|nr:DEAH box polypeptide 37 [Zalerion maritima]